MPRLRPGIGCALGAAALFGASTPFAKLLLGEVSPLMLAGILYLGSGIGLALWLAVRGRVFRDERRFSLAPADLPKDSSRVTRPCSGDLGPTRPSLLRWPGR